MSNTKFGTYVSSIEMWRTYDALPPELRAVLRNAPYDYFAGDFLKSFQAIKDIKESRNFFIDAIFKDRDKRILETYGPDHPMIGARPKGYP